MPPRRRLRIARILKLVAGTLLAGYLLMCLGLFSLARRLTFPAPLARAWPTSARTAPLRIPSAAGDVLAWHVPAPEGRPTLLYFHGNGESLPDAIPFGDWAREHHLGLFAVEYPGYFGAPGKPTEKSITTTARAAATYLRDTLHVPRAQTVLVGRSLGTGVAAVLATENVAARLVLLSPYTSLPDVGARAFPFIPVRLLMLDRFNTLSRATQIHVPTLVVHGDADQVIPVDLGRTVAHAIAGATYVEIPNAGHNDLPDRPDVLKRIAAFADGAL